VRQVRCQILLGIEKCDNNHGQFALVTYSFMAEPPQRASRRRSRINAVVPYEHARGHKGHRKDKEAHLIHGRILAEFRLNPLPGWTFKDYALEYFGFKEDKARYWARKASDRDFHPLSHGGLRDPLAEPETPRLRALWQVWLL
jgi:hypothetical protein